MAPTTLYEKIWRSHVVVEETPEHPAVLYIDRHLIHEVTSPQAFAALDARGLTVRRPDLTTATCDHSTPTLPPDAKGGRAYVSDAARRQVETLQANCDAHGVEYFGWGSAHRGVVHVMGPELGLTLPGATIVCGDSHTATHGAFGALAFGVGTSEVGHVLATQCLLQRRSKTLAVTVTGQLPAGVHAKDLILAIIAEIGVGGGTGHVIEYRGPAIEALDMESRMTVCNMSIEAGARAGMIAPDETTFASLEGRPRSPKAASFDQAVARWRTLRTDPEAAFDREITIDASALTPRVTWGDNPAQGSSVEGATPLVTDADARAGLEYMRLEPGQALRGHPIQAVFVGSCTNGRLSDLKAAADVLKGRQVAHGVRMLVVPGSEQVKREAEALGLDAVFRQAGAEWREPGCSMCLAMNGDVGEPGELVVSTSNRNFRGRQGPGVRTVLASPATAAASALAGALEDPRIYLGAGHER
ncbi:MAG: 3-isopropylmalate dehydratase large subunit [Maricaulaceae bacterium]